MTCDAVHKATDVKCHSPKNHKNEWHFAIIIPNKYVCWK